MAIKILIADDHALLRQGIKRVLNFEDGFEVIGEAEDGQEAVARTLMLQPDVLLLDINMPGLKRGAGVSPERCGTGSAHQGYPCSERRRCFRLSGTGGAPFWQCHRIR